MPRNTSGVYTLPAGNPVTPGTVIDAEWANSTLEDLANEITNSLSRTGAGGMLAPFRIADGTVTGPGLSYLNETNTGLYRSGAGSTWMSVLGVNVAQFSTVGVTIPFGKALTAQGNASVAGTVAVTGATTLGSTLAVTGAITASGGVIGNVTGNVTATSGSSTFNNLTISGSLDMDAGSSATITGLSTPVNASDAANKGYVDSVLGSKLSLTGGTMSGAIAMGNSKITGLATPTADTDAATKAYVDSTAQGLDVKASCRVATTANITLSGTQIIDGISVVVGNRVLVKNQTTTTQNGIYVVASGAWTRPPDADTCAELAGAFTFIENGYTNYNSGWVCQTDPDGIIGIQPIEWIQFSGAGQINAGTGMTKSGNTLNVNTASSSRIVVNTDDIDLATTGVTAGTYKSVTVDAYGRVTGGSNPNTLAGYGITDAYTTSQVDALVNAKLSLTGGTMSGAIAMGTNKITGLGDPTSAQDAATKNYIDTIFGSTTTAAASAAAAAASATSASNSATSASNSATAAAGSATSAANSYTTFNNQYLGSKSSDPTVNNTGGALVAGNLYWNSTANEMRVYTGSAWLTAYLPATGYLALTGGTLTGNLGFNGTGLRITGDFTNATYSSRLMFQTSTANGATNVAALPNGTSAQSTFEVFGASDTTNAPFGRFLINATQVSLRAAINGTGAYLPFTLWTGGSERFRVNETTGNFLIGSSTDNGTDKLQVTGSMSLSSALRVGATPDAGTAGQVLTSAGAGAPPTWSAPPASAGTVTAVASGSLSDGTKVILNSDGTVSAVTATGASTLTSVTAGLSSGVAYGDYNTVSGVYGTQDNRIVVFYIGTSANRYLYAVVGSIVGSTVTFGTPIVLSSNAHQQGINYGIVAAYDAVNNRYHCIVNQVSSNYGTNAYATINPATLGFVSYGYQTAYWANGYSPAGWGFIASKTTTQGLIVFCAQTDAYTYAQGVTFTAGYPYISIGAPTLIDGYYGSYPMIPSFNSDATKAVVPYSRDSGNMAVALLSCSGTTVSLNALQTIASENTSSYPKVSAYSSALDKFLVAWGSSAGSIKGSVVTVSGSSLSYGTPVVISGLSTSDYPYDITYYELTGDFWFSALRSSKQLTISGTTFSQGGSSSTINNIETQYGTMYFYNPVSATLVQASWAGSSNKVQLCNATAYSSTLTSTNFLGISNAAYTNGQTATIQTVGSTDDAQSGLTPGLKYYVNPDGTLSTLTTSQPYAGLALTATKLVIKG